MIMKTEIEIDVSVDLEVEGVSTSLYLGEGACEPAFEDVESWKEIVERTIGYYIRPNTKTINSQDLGELEDIAAGLESALALFREKMEEYKE